MATPSETAGEQEYTRFRVGVPNTNPNQFNPDCISLDTVSHVAHVEMAVSILQAGAIRAGLVYDQSKLNRERILVAWLSPNYWHYGSRYGNVSFNFRWVDLLGSLKTYWVESIAYSPPACRILLSGAERSEVVQPYDPTRGDGPWWHRREQDDHWWNGQICLEIMMEMDVPLSMVTSIDFVDHHEKACNIAPKECPDCGLSASRGGARLVAAIAGNRITVESKWFEGPTVSGAVTGVIRDLQALHTTAPYASVRRDTEAAEPLMRSLLSAYARRDSADCAQLAGLFVSEDDLTKSAYRVIESSLGQAWI